MDTNNIKVIKADGKEAHVKPSVSEINNEIKVKIEFLETAHIDEVHLFDEDLNLPLNCPFYGDGYQMLASYVGELGDIYKNSYSTSDNKHKFPKNHNFETVYNYIVISAPDGYRLYGATSCNRFKTEFRLSGSRLIVAQNFESKEHSVGSVVNLEGFVILKNKNLGKLFDEFSTFIEHNHPRRIFKENPVGWCTWYAFDKDISKEKIIGAVNEIEEKAPFLDYIQIDAGYHPFVGDWLDIKDGMNSDMKSVCLEIKESGFKPGIWVAPFIASKGSRILKEHPDWFIKDDNGLPLCADDVTKPAFLDAPWYFLDPTNPDALKHITDVCKVMKDEWKVTYYKFDANVWGALPFGHRYNDNMTSIESYRYGMQAICDALGDDCYIMVCTAPFWPSLGLTNGIRTSCDIVRMKNPLLRNVRENLHRAWQNQHLWLVDPDVLITDTEPTLEKSLVKLQNICIAASGGIKIFGDDPKVITPEIASFLQRLINHKNIAAKFSLDLSEGITETEDYTDYFYFNYSEKEIKTFNAPLSALDVYENKEVTTNGTITLEPLSAEWLRVQK